MKKVILGVTASISAYKAIEILREFQKRGWAVKVVMTENSTNFVSPLTFRSLSGEDVITSQFRDLKSGLEHIELCENSEALLIAPATADVIAKFSCGIADDFLSSLYLACKKPVFLAPAMNEEMLLHPATQRNLKRLKEDGVFIIEPESGYLACKEEGEGRLAEPKRIVFNVISGLGKEMKRVKVLVTAGATREFIDDVRFISNSSSGKQGVAIAHEAALMGADVLLLLSASSCEKTFVKTERFDAVDELRKRLKGRDFDIFFMTAAVGDFKPVRRFKEKIKREGKLNIEFGMTHDILKEISQKKREHQVIVAFAAEARDFIERGKKKLLEKEADILFVNPVRSGVGFSAEENEGYLIFRDGRTKRIERASKEKVSKTIIKRVLEYYKGISGGGNVL